MFRKSSPRRDRKRDREQDYNRQTLLLLSEITLLAATGLFLLTGCGGGSNNSGGGGGSQTPSPTFSLTKYEGVRKPARPNAPPSPQNGGLARFMH